jgi:hypothetical protein
MLEVGVDRHSMIYRAVCGLRKIIDVCGRSSSCSTFACNERIDLDTTESSGVIFVKERTMGHERGHRLFQEVGYSNVLRL